MADQKPDYDVMEQELYALLGESPRACPSAALLRAYGQDVLTAEVESVVKQHVQRCDLCAMLVADLASLEGAPATPAQLARMGAGLPLTSPKARSAGMARSRVFTAVAAVLLVCASVAAWMHLRDRTGTPVATGVQQAPQRPAVVAALEIPLAPLAAPAADESTLQTRGHGGSTPSVSELMPAFTAYNSADYATAAQQFAPLAKSYPHSALVSLYLGVSQLELHQDGAAAQSLERARANTTPQFADELEWYSAVAAQRIGKAAEAHTLLEQLCSDTQSKYSTESCRIAPTLKP